MDVRAEGDGVRLSRSLAVHQAEGGVYGITFETITSMCWTGARSANGLFDIKPG